MRIVNRPVEADPDQVAAELIEAARGLGLEHGIDTALRVLFARWVTVGAPTGEELWNSLVHAPDVPTQRRQFRKLSVFGRPEFDVEDGSVVESEVDAALGRMIRVVNEIGDDPGVTQTRIQMVFESVLANLGRLGKQVGEAETPVRIAELMAAITVRPRDKVFDPACGNATGLLAAALRYPNVTVSGYEINRRVANRASMRLWVNGIKAIVSPGDSLYSDNSYEREADVVVAQPPWDAAFSGQQRERIHDMARRFGIDGRRSVLRGGMPWLLLAVDSLREDGRAAILLPAASGSTAFQEVHKALINGGLVEAIVSLPSGLFTHTSISTLLWLLRAPDGDRCDSVLFIDAESLANQTRRGGRELSEEAVWQLTSIIEEHRKGELSAPTYVAKRVDYSDLGSSLDPNSYLDPSPEPVMVHPRPARSLLTSVELTNFKAFGSTARVPLAPLTLVYGANSSGKSSVIQSLLLLKQSLSSARLVTQGSVLNSGSFRGVVHGKAARPVTIGFSYGALPEWISVTGTPDPSMERDAKWSFAADSSGVGCVVGASYGFGPYTFRFKRHLEDRACYRLDTDEIENILVGVAEGTLLYPFDSRLYKDGELDELAKRKAGRELNARRTLRILRKNDVFELRFKATGLLPTGTAIPGLASIPGQRDEGIVNSYLNRAGQLAAGVSTEVSSLLSDLVWIGPLRSAPKRVYERAEAHEETGDGRHVAIYLYDHATVASEVNEWLTQLEIPYVIEVVPVATEAAADFVGDLVAIALTDTRSKVTVTPVDVGFGISQVLPIVVELLARRNCVIAIEQPETHLHPRLQTRIADLMIESIQEGGRGNQLIVETHSEHLMLRIQRRIREGSLSPDLVSVVYVDQDDSGQAVVQPLRLDIDGNFLDEWPNGFFDDRLEELFGDL